MSVAADPRNSRCGAADSAGFWFGLVTGAALGAGLTVYFAPRIGADIRKRVAASAKDLGDTASGYYDDVSTRVVEAVEELTAKGQEVRDAVADVVARSAHEVARGAREIERVADAAKAR
jgi:gas vesicle protein